MKYFILFNIFAIVIFILLILSRPLHMTMDIKNNNADKLDNIRNILVYVSCAMSFLCLGLLELSIKTKENPLIPFIWPYTMAGFVLCAVSSIALGNVAIYETKNEVRANVVLDIPRIVSIISINFVILICMKRLIVLKYDSEHVSSSKREFVPREIISKKIFTL